MLSIRKDIYSVKEEGPTCLMTGVSFPEKPLTPATRPSLPERLRNERLGRSPGRTGFQGSARPAAVVLGCRGGAKAQRGRETGPGSHSCCQEARAASVLLHPRGTDSVSSRLREPSPPPSGELKGPSRQVDGAREARREPVPHAPGPGATCPGFPRLSWSPAAAPGSCCALRREGGCSCKPKELLGV